MKSFFVDGKSLSIQNVAEIASDLEFNLKLAPEVLENMEKSRAWVEKAVKEQRVMYGITTGFGMFKHRIIPRELVSELQKNLIRSHSSGVGEPFSKKITRAIILVRVNSLARGYSGIRKEILDFLLEIVNKDIYPYIPSQGSVGSSGDLAPLCHLSLLLLGEGECIVEGKRVPSREVLETHGLFPIELGAKEGLALSNGTSVQTAIAALALYQSAHLLDIADIAGAMSVEVLMGSRIPFLPQIHKIRNQLGEQEVARNIFGLIEESAMIHSHFGCGRVQDSYSLRCIPQVHGPARDAFLWSASIISRELNATTDNPLIFADEDASYSGGNFHGEYIGMAMDTLKIAMAEIANISERRTAKMMDPSTNEGLPAFLVAPELAGVNSGMMIAQYTAAALVSENKILAHPATVDSIPTSANQEDHVSMGTIAARNALLLVKNVRAVLAIELMCLSQAAEFRRPISFSPKTQPMYEMIRKNIPALTKDRVLAKDIEILERLIFSGTLQIITKEYPFWHSSLEHCAIPI